MAYATETDIIKRISKAEYNKMVTVSYGDGLSPADIRDEALDTASSIIDSYLQGRIAELPIDTPPRSIVQACCDITIYNLHSRIQYIDIPDWINSRYQACMQWLKDVSKGLANIDNSTLTDDEEESGSVTYGSDRCSVMGSDTF